MSARLRELARRKQALVACAADQRVALAACAQPLAAPGRLADRVLAASRAAQMHPAWIAAAAATLIAVYPRGSMRWLERAWMVWRGVQALRGSLR